MKSVPRGWLAFCIVIVEVLGVGLWLLFLAEMATRVSNDQRHWGISTGEVLVLASISVLVPPVSLAVRRRPSSLDFLLLVVVIAGVGSYEYLRQAHLLMPYNEWVKGQWGEE